MEIRNEMLMELKNLETKINNQINANKNEFSLNFEQVSKKLKEITENNKSLLEMVLSYKIKGEKISEFDNFRKKVEDMLVAHELRIHNSSEEVKAMKDKYDKIIFDNLEVPGYIGANCQFKNLSEYLINNINETNKLKNEKEILKKDSKELKLKFDNFLKNILSLIDNSVTRCQEYTDTGRKDFESMLNVKLKEFSEKTFQIKSDICKVQMDTDKLIQNIKKELEDHKKLIDGLDEKILTTEEKINERLNIFENEKNDIKNDILNIKNNNINTSKELSEIKDNIKYLKTIMKVTSKRNSMPALNLNSHATNYYSPDKFFNRRKNQTNNNNINNKGKSILNIIENSPIKSSQSPKKIPNERRAIQLLNQPALDENMEISISDDSSSSSSSSKINVVKNRKRSDSVTMNNSVLNRVKNKFILPCIDKSFVENGKIISNKRNVNICQKLNLEQINNSIENSKQNNNEIEKNEFEESNKKDQIIPNEENKINNFALTKKNSETSTIPVKNNQITEIYNNNSHLNKINPHYAVNTNCNTLNFYNYNCKVVRKIKCNYIKKDNIDIDYKIVNLELDKKAIIPSKQVGLLALENRRFKNKNILKDNFLSPSINDIIKNQKNFANSRKKFLSKGDINPKYLTKSFGKTATNSFNKKNIDLTNKTTRSNNKIFIHNISSIKNNVQNKKIIFNTEYKL